MRLRWLPLALLLPALAGCLEAPGIGSAATFTAPEWEVGDRWTYRVTDGNETWNTTFQVAGRAVANDQDVWVVNRTTSARPFAGEREPSRTTEYYALDTLNPVWDWCDEPHTGDFGACSGTEPWFNFPLRDGETWTWQRGGDVVTHVRSEARVEGDNATLHHTWVDSDFEATHVFERDAPFYTGYVLRGPGDRTETWTLLDLAE